MKVFFINRLHVTFLFLSLLIMLSSGKPLAENQDKINTIVLDAGHGGKDPGAIGSIIKEKDVALIIALKVGKLINENVPDVKVIYTRTEDVFVPLNERAEIANKNNADLFISIHINANAKTEISGTSSHVLGLHRADEQFEVAKRENGVILLEKDYNTRYEGFNPNEPSSYIMFTLMQNIYLDQSINMAAMVQEQFREKARREDRGIVQQGLLVLAQTAMPAVLIETGFITNHTDEQFLASEQGQDLISSAIYRAFKDYKNNIESRSKFADASTMKTAASNNAISFRVQVLTSSKPLSEKPASLQNYSNINELKIGAVYKYTVGDEPDLAKINQLKSQVQKDFPDAFVIAVKNGEQIPIKQAIIETQTIE